MQQSGWCSTDLRHGILDNPVTCVAHVQGVIPPDWGQPGAFPSLQHLNIGGNQLKGLLPEIGVGAMSKLEVSTRTLPYTVDTLQAMLFNILHTTDKLKCRF